MSLLDDTAIFAAIITEGGLNRAAKKLGFSNGLISRRLTQLEERLGVTLLKRTTRQLQLTPEGELYWQHAKRIQQELDCAVCLIQSLADKPTGNIRVSAATYFGRHFLAPMLSQFMKNVPGVSIDLIISDELLDPIKENIDLLIRGAGFFNAGMKDSSLKSKLLVTGKIKLFASPAYLMKSGIPQNLDELLQHQMIGYKGPSHTETTEVWEYHYKNKTAQFEFSPFFSCNDMEGRLTMCLEGHGIAKLTEFVNLKVAENNQTLQIVLPEYDWGSLHIYAVYAQQSLPKRTRLLLDYIVAQTQLLQKSVSGSAG